MTKELQDLAWSVLPKEFKEEVKSHYVGLNAAYRALFSKDSLTNAECDRCNAMREKIVLYNMYFGHHNLTSDAEGEEMLTMSRKRVQELYSSYCTERDEEEPGSNRSSLGGRIAMLQELFGSKCLPDEAKPQPKFHKGDKVKVIIDGYCKDAVLIVTDVNEGYPQFSYKLSCSPNVWFAESTLSLYEEPKPAEPKFNYKVDDKVRVKGVNNYILCGKVGVIKKLPDEIEPFNYKIGFENDKYTYLSEEYLEPYTDPKEDLIPPNSGELESQEADKSFDNILKDSFSKERRLNIAAMIMASMMQNAKWGNKYSHIARMACAAADALIAESEKGSES